jgi:hypothetical protein
VLAGSETALKAWAAQTQADVQDLARPDLINWDAFIENFKAQMDREAAQEMTIDIAVERLNAAGLLSGSDEERRKKVAEALGIAEPSITIDTLFQVGEEPSVARQNLLSQFLGDATALPVPVTPVWTTSTTTTEQGDVDAVGPKGPAALGAGSETLAGMYDAEVAKPDLEKQGQLSISYLTQGALSELENQPVALKVAAAWTTDFTENWQAFEAIGTSTGNVTFQAFYKAMEDNIGRVRRRMAEIILPEVVAMLAGSRSGSLP